MISRLVRAAASLFLYFCMATILTQIILLIFLSSKWQLNRNKLVQILAVAQGVDLLAIREQAQAEGDEISTEQVSYEQIRETRAVKLRHLELREQALRQGLGQLVAEQRKLAGEMQLRDSFQKELLAMQQGAVVTGLENARTMLESLKPPQAKEQLVEMLKKDELDQVVALLVAMPASKAGKILKEFKLEGEPEQLYQIIRRIREGYPNSGLPAQTQSELNQPNLTGP